MIQVTLNSPSQRRPFFFDDNGTEYLLDSGATVAVISESKKNELGAFEVIGTARLTGFGSNEQKGEYCKVVRWDTVEIKQGGVTVIRYKNFLGVLSSQHYCDIVLPLDIFPRKEVCIVLGDYIRIDTSVDVTCPYIKGDTWAEIIANIKSYGIEPSYSFHRHLWNVMQK